MASDPGRCVRRLVRLCLAAAAVAFAAVVPPVPAALASTGPALSVNATSTDQHAISPNIYGLNFAGAAQAKAISLPVDRWGGNGTETDNYKLGSQNTGADWYFENVSDCFSAEFSWCDGLTTNNVFAYRNFVAKDRQVGARTLITLPQ